MSTPDSHQDEDVRSLFSMLGKDREAGRYRNFDTALPPLPAGPAATPARMPLPAVDTAPAAVPPAVADFELPPPGTLPGALAAAAPAASASPDARAPVAPAAVATPVAPPTIPPIPPTPPRTPAGSDPAPDARPLGEVFQRALGEQADRDLGAALRRIARS